MLAGAAKKGGTAVKAVCQAGGYTPGLVTAAGTTAKTVCCKYQLWVAQE